MMEAHLREVQKLESLGVLAGGIAHDFNNLLMAIVGNADLAKLGLELDSPALASLEEITGRRSGPRTCAADAGLLRPGALRHRALRPVGDGPGDDPDARGVGVQEGQPAL